MSTNKMWGGRFEGSPASAMQDITPSIDFDKRLAEQDIAGSCAHAKMLAAQGIISKTDCDEILSGLSTVEKEIVEGKFVFKRELEDIHLNIESRLKEIVGEAAGRLHTARSRNDQVVTDLRLWLRLNSELAQDFIALLMRELVTQADAHAGTIMPGFTHMQPAQPITFGHHLLAYVEMLARDHARLKDMATRLNESPLGSAALAGTSFPIDREMTAKALGFERPMRNSLDAVSARDFALEFLSAATICMTHLSRLAGELVQWTSPAFGFVKLSDAYTTGSSIMPQKRNPDAAELIRGKTGRVLGDFIGLATVVKGLALAYGSDLQEDKERIFDAADTLSLSLRAMAGMIHDLKVNKDAMRRAAVPGYPTATDLADWIVRVLKKPFRDAHHITGSIVKRAEDLDVELDTLPLAEMQAIEPAITKDVFAVLSLEASVNSRQSYGGTAPIRVREQIAFWQKTLETMTW
jgi:argininosuccinate lyase